jgi:hypothetical protein
LPKDVGIIGQYPADSRLALQDPGGGLEYQKVDLGLGIGPTKCAHRRKREDDIPQ